MRVAFRDKKFVDKFYYLMNKYHFDNVDPNQAYMNEICEDKIYHLPKEWDAMPRYYPQQSYLQQNQKHSSKNSSYLALNHDH